MANTNTQNQGTQRDPGKSGMGSERQHEQQGDVGSHRQQQSEIREEDRRQQGSDLDSGRSSSEQSDQR